MYCSTRASLPSQFRSGSRLFNAVTMDVPFDTLVRFHRFFVKMLTGCLLGCFIFTVTTHQKSIPLRTGWATLIIMSSLVNSSLQTNRWSPTASTAYFGSSKLNFLPGIPAPGDSQFALCSTPAKSANARAASVALTSAIRYLFPYILESGR